VRGPTRTLFLIKASQLAQLAALALHLRGVGTRAGRPALSHLVDQGVSESAITQVLHSQARCACSHIDSVTGLLQTRVCRQVGVHLARGVLFAVVHAVQTRLALAVHLVLVVALNFVVRVSENFAVLCLLNALRLRKAHVQHVLVVLHEGGVAAELIVEAVLSVRKHVTLVSHRRSV